MTMTFPLPVDSRTIAQIGTRVRSTTLFYEDWHDGFLNAAKWEYAVTSGGSVAVSNAPGLLAGMPSSATLAQNGAAADVGKLYTQVPFPIMYGQTALTTPLERLNLEYASYNDSAATLIDNSTSFLGLSYAQAALRSSNNIIGFYWASDVLRAICDNAGTETTSALTTAPTVTTLHKYRISIDRLNGVLFYVDDVLQATITTNIPNIQSVFINYYFQGDAAQTTSVKIGTVRLWMEDLI